MQKIFKIINQFILPIILVGWCAVLLSQKIDLTTADIGRHIKNGEILTHSPWQEKWQLLHTNFYSYTEPNHEFVNHHWLSGVVFYCAHQFFGFKGLSVLYIAIVALAFLLFYLFAQKRAGPAIASVLSVLVLPIITSRTEIRPEGFTYLFMGIFYWVLSKDQGLNIKDKTLWLLPFVMLLWVNLHIGFIFGFLILGAFWLEGVFLSFRASANEPKNRLKKLTIISILCLLAGVINPFGIKGLLYPLNIFREYGYLIVENQSVMFLERLGVGQSLYFGLFKFLLGLSVVLFIGRFIFFVVVAKIKKRKIDSSLGVGITKKEKSEIIWLQFPYHEFLLLAVAGFLAFFATRNFPVFGLLFLPITGFNIRTVLPEVKHTAYKLIPVIIAVMVLFFGSFRFWENIKNNQKTFGLGLMYGIEGAGEFFKKEKIKGPIFNNYDIGGYLIYYLHSSPLISPSQTGEGRVGVVFTDNRPEAYSIAHFKKDYIPAQEDSVKWKELDSKYKFNAIFFSHRDLTPWGQAFLISKVKDSEWAPIFADEYSIIFVKRNTQNQELISKYLIPSQRFRVISN